MTASWKRAAVATVALAFAAAGLMPLPANATTPVDGNIEQRENASVTIHKFETGSLVGSPINADTPNAEGDGLKGVEFKLFKLDADLTTPAGWDKLKAAKDVPATACNADGEADWAQFTALGQDNTFQMQTVKTGEQGMVKVSNLKTGAYLVCEGSAVGATNKAGEPVTVVKKSAPFVVTLPMQHPQGHGWLYDVHVYPKNTVLEAPVKTMEVVKHGLGDEKGVKISITGKVPSLAAGESFDYFSIVDPMVAELINPSDYSVTLTKNSNVTPLSQSVDYTVDYGDASSASKNMVAVNFTRAGLNRLKESTNANAEIKLEFHATMNAVPQDGAATNRGYVYTNKVSSETPGEPQTPVTPPTVAGGEPVEKPGNPKGVKSQNSVKMTWAPVKITKHDAQAQNVKLAGAEFKVYAAKNQDEASCVAGASNKETEGEAISVKVNGVVTDTFKTAQDGSITIPGLFIDKHAADDPGSPSPKTKRCFVLVETKAPAGYVLPEGDNAKFVVLADSAATAPVEAQIPNTQIAAGDIPALPLTGAFGQVLLTAGGVALMGGAVAFYLVARRRKAAQA